MSIQRESLRLLALTETESLKEDFSSWVAELNKKISASPSDEIQEEKKIIGEEPEKKKVESEEYPGIQMKYQGQDIQISTVCFAALDSIKNVSSVDGIILVFNEAKEGVEKLQNMMNDVVKVLSPGFKQKILILFKQTDGGVNQDISIDERNLFRYQESEKTIENLLDRMITITKKHEIKKGLIEKAIMPVWKKEQYLKSFQKKREFSQKLFYFNYRYFSRAIEMIMIMLVICQQKKILIC